MIHAIVTKVHALTFDTKPYESRTLAPSDASFFLSKPFPFAKKSLRNDEDDFCFSKPKDHSAVPCGHVCVCESCSAKLKACPYCAQPVQLWMKIHIV